MAIATPPLPPKTAARANPLSRHHAAPAFFCPLEAATRSSCTSQSAFSRSTTPQCYNKQVVNDGGDPSEVESLVQQYASVAKGRIRVVHNPQSLGMEGASRIGLDATDSDLLILHDDDDAWAPDFLTLLELIRQITGEFGGLSVTEIPRTICELLEWKRPNGSLKNHECRQGADSGSQRA